VVLSSVKMRELAMNALVWDQESATIKMFCLMSINDVNTNFAARLIGLPAMLQNPMAHVLLERAGVPVRWISSGVVTCARGQAGDPDDLRAFASVVMDKC